MRIEIYGWAGGRFRRISYCQPDESDGIQIVGAPTCRTRSLRDRIYALFCVSGLQVPRGIRITIDPPIHAGGTADLDVAIFLGAVLEAGINSEDPPTNAPRLLTPVVEVADAKKDELRGGSARNAPVRDRRESRTGSL